MINPKAPFAKQFLWRWKNLDRSKYPAASGSDSISAMSALAFDSVNVMEAAFTSLLKEKPNLFRHNIKRGKKKRVKLINCNFFFAKHILV